MAMSFSRSDPGAPAQVAEATFSTTRRGYDQDEVRDFNAFHGSWIYEVTEITAEKIRYGMGDLVEDA